MLSSKLSAVIKCRKFPHSSQLGHPHCQDLLPLGVLFSLSSLGPPLLAAGGDPLSQAPLVRCEVSPGLHQACWLPGHLTLAAAQGQDQLGEKNSLSTAQIASVNLFQIRYIVSAITNPLTSVPSANSISPNAARTILLKQMGSVMLRGTLGHQAYPGPVVF